MVEHIPVWRLDGDSAHNQVFVWAWQGEMGAIGFSDGHVDSTEDQVLFDEVVSVGRGALHSEKMTYVE